MRTRARWCAAAPAAGAGSSRPGRPRPWANGSLGVGCRARSLYQWPGPGSGGPPPRGEADFSAGGRKGREAGDPEVRAHVGAVFGVMPTVSLDWAGDPGMDCVETLDRALACLERGIRLQPGQWPPPGPERSAVAGPMAQRTRRLLSQ
ncbi:hypothetical protein [Streptomyces sp. AV19]|uniref:acyl-CoA-like ligand-binding transcription factor n=1 Tax=Streptomyces sp. AV19 TaxID=2793068 RepID=UPI0032218DCE